MLPQPAFFCNSDYTDKQHMENEILYFRQHVLFVFLWTLRFIEPPQNEVLASSSCQMACIEILPPPMRSNGKTNFSKEKERRLITCVQPANRAALSCCRIPVDHIKAVYDGFIDIHET